MRYLIFGAAGSIGSELYKQLATEDNEVFAFDIDETRTFDLHEEYRLKNLNVHYRIGDIKDKQTVREVIQDFQPDVIFHAAALKHVTPHEEEPRGAVETNVIGTLNIVESAKREGIDKLVFVSTDKVVNQHCVMGTTKRLGELIAKNAGFVAVRFGNVLGSRGSVIPIWEAQLERGDPLTITDKRMKRYTMSIPQACKLLIEAAKVGEPGQVMIMDMGKPSTIEEIAEWFLVTKGIETYKFRYIGARPGEALEEKLMTEEEEKRAVKINGFYVL